VLCSSTGHVELAPDDATGHERDRIGHRGFVLPRVRCRIIDVNVWNGLVMLAIESASDVKA
jgi:hypothetical protein